jgi:hypothetical protein
MIQETNGINYAYYIEEIEVDNDTSYQGIDEI